MSCPDCLNLALFVRVELEKVELRLLVLEAGKTVEDSLGELKAAIEAAGDL